ncbi:MAG: SpoIIE family protein phosphatase [Lachnospiraceae bacterium]|nr:SpoIIE family protein phosphatase [Lachnospiraceae bacterium]
MAQSMDVLAKTFGKAKEEPGLSKEDGLAALEAATAMVCGECTGCGIRNQCRQGDGDENYYLYYLLRTFEKKGSVDYEDMPRRFLEVCRRKSDYLGHLNRNLGRATMNLTWKNRFLESRDAVMVQFEEMAGILEEFSGQMARAVDVTARWEPALQAMLKKRRIAVEHVLVLQYEEQQREVYFTARMTNGRCMTVRDAAELVGRAMKGTWSPAKDGKTIITRNAAAFRFVEDGKYRMLFGVSRVPRGGEEISGDSYTVKSRLPGQAIMSLSDGMGSGSMANEDSEKVIELTEQLLETGFSARAALKLVNTVLLLTGKNERPATLDLCLVDLYSGVVEAMKLGAVASFVIGRETVEVLESEHVPAGVLNPVEPLLLSRKLWDSDRIVMVSDGVLDAMPGDEKEEAMKDFLAGLPEAGPQETAEMIMTYALALDQEPRDDMTVLVGGIYGR